MRFSGACSVRSRNTNLRRSVGHKPAGSLKRLRTPFGNRGWDSGFGVHRAPYLVMVHKKIFKTDLIEREASAKGTPM